MKTRISLSHSRRNLNVLLACLLSFSLFTMPFVPMAAAMSRSDRQASSLRRDKSSQVQLPVKATLGVNAPVPTAAPEPFAPVITATKVDALLNDDGDGKADPGTTEKIEYTVTISNTGTTDATNVQFTDTIDPHTTLVGGTITTQPIAVNDSFSALGNVRIQVPDGASDLLGNDCDPDAGGGPCTNAGLTITTLAGDNSAPFNGTSAQGGQVTATTGDGSFQYNPAPGFEGSDSFTYTVTDGTGKSDTATVTVTVSGMIWFVNAAAPAGGDGRLTNPFNCLVGTGCFSSTTADEPGDFIFLFSGTYNDNAALVLLNNQKVIGAAATVPLAGPGSITGFTIPTFSDALPATGGASPVVTSTASGIQLASGNLLRGFTVGNTATTAGNYDILNTSTATVGTLTILEVILNGTGGLFRADSGGTLNVTFPTATTTSAGSNGFHIGGVISGSVTVSGGAISGVVGSDVAINGGTVAFSCAAGITHAAAGTAMVDIANHSGGTVTFTGALSATNGTGLQFNNADSTYNFNGTNTLNGGDAGIDITNGSGGTFSFSATSTITSPSGTAFNVASSPGSPNVTYSGSITHNTAGQRAVNIDGTTGGSISITTVTAGSTAGGVGNTGVNINNAAGSVSFTTLSLGTSGTRMTQQALTITGGSGAKTLGTVNIFTSGAQGIVASNSTGQINSTTGEINAVNSAAVNIVGTSAGSRTPLNMTLTKVNATGTPGNGIILTNVNGPSTAVGFVVNGDGINTVKGGNGTGGTIANTTGADGATTGIGIRLENADEVTLRRMQLNDHSNFAIRGISASNLIFEYSTINGTNGTSASADDCSIFLTDTTGTNTISNDILQGGWENTVRVLNTGSTVLTQLTMNNNTISQTATTEGNDAVQFETQGTSQQTLSLTGSLLTAAKGDLIDCTTGFGSTMSIAFKNNAVSNNHSAIVAAGGGSKFSSTGTLNIDIDGNTFRDAVGNLLFINASGTASPGVEQGVVNGYVRNNIFGVAGIANSGSTSGSTLQIESNGGGDDTLVISNNQAFQYNNHGIFLSFVDDQGKTANINVTVDSNTVNTPGNLNTNFNGFHLNNGATSGPPAPGDDFSSCIDVKNNNFTGGGQGATSPNNNDVRLRQRIITTVRLPGYLGANNDNAAVITYLRTAGGGGIKNNSFGTGNAANTVATGGGGYINTTPAGTPCLQPSFPSLSAPTTSEAAVNSPVQKQQPVVGVANANASSTVAAVETKRPEASVAKAVKASDARSQRVAQSNVKAVDNASSQVTAKAKAVSTAKAQPLNEARKPAIHSHHARIVRPMSAAPLPMAGETVGPILIGTLRAGDSVTITFQVTVNNPPNLTGVPPGTPQVENQGSVSFAESGTPVLTDDPALGGGADKTATPVDLFDTSTNLASNLNPSNFGDLVTFTATVSETPVQGSADPTGTVDFIDTSNGNAVICNDVALSGGSAQCQTSTLTAGTHNIRADYSGDGNFDPSQSNVVAQVVNACTPNPIVTSTADSGAGTLRDALAQVCSGTTITFNIAGAGPHTITLTSGELVVGRNVTINNNSGEKITVSGNNLSRVFNINSGKTAAIIGLTMSGGNSAADGGAILNDGTLTIVNSTLSGNTTAIDGGAIRSSATAPSLTLINTTISGNSAAGSGGGVIVLGGTMTSINSTISNNFADSDNNSAGDGGGIRAHAGTTTLKNTIVAGNFNEDGASDAADDISGTVDAASSFNLIGTGGSGGLTNGVNNNQVGVSAGIGPLADNGGLTQTHALLPTSLAVETGSNANLPVDTFDLDGDANTAETLPVDQRGVGFPRNADSADANVVQTVDIGAFELHPSIEDIADQSTAEDTVKNVTFNLGDDTGSLIATVVATSSNTTLVPNANLSFSGSGGSRTLQITPAANQSGVTTITVTVTATNGRTATDTFDLTVTAANDPPSGTDNTVSTAEDAFYTFSAADFGFTDPNDTPPNTLLAVKITTLPGLGTLTNNNVAVVAGNFIPVADINAGLLKFTPAANGNGTPYTTFTFQVQDDGGGTDLDPTPNTMTINVTAVNDGPVNTVPGPQNTNEDTALVFSSGNGNQISVADIDAGANPVKITLTATNGTITLSTTAGLSFITGDGTADATMMFTGTLSAVNTALNGMSFNPTADFNGAASLQIVSDDQGNTGAGGPLTDTDSVSITVNAQNDAPVVTTSAGNTSFTENGAAVAIDTALTVTDGDSANLASAEVAITAGFVSGQDTLSFTNQNGISGNYNSGTGVLTLTGSSSVANYQTALRSVTYSNSSDNPTASRTVSFKVNDGTSDSNTATKGITINAVNDAPVNTVPGPQSTNQNTPLTFSSGNGNQISVADVDAGTNAIQVTLTATNGTLTLSGTSGLAFTVGDGTADSTMTFTGTIANINTALNGMTFTPTLGFSGAATLTITTNDLGNSGSGGPLTDTDTVNIQVATNVSIQDAQVNEPQSGSVNMIFTVTLSAPAPAGGASVSFTTVELAPALNHATAGQDYTTTSGTVSFAAGEQFKTIQVPVLSDNKKSEANESFEVQLSNPVNCTIADGTATGTIIENATAGAVLIGEIRTSGPAGAGDDFVEIYNNSDSPHVVNGTGGGYGLFKMGATCSDTPVLIGVIPNGTTIPGRGHFLFTGSAYSLADYGGTGAAAGDVTLSSDIESDRNVAIFSTASLGSIGSANRLDAVGFGSNVGGTCDLFREGNTLTATNGTPLEHSYFRDECGKKGNPSTFGNCPTGGFTKDSNVNADDFIFADTNATATIMGQRLGAPGPQNLGSPRFTLDVVALLLDSTKGSAGNPNRVRDTTAIGPNAANGTMSIRRRFQNNTGAPVTRLRIRVVDISTTFVSGGGVADLRLLTSGDTTDTVGDPATCTASGFPSSPCTVTIRGTTLETPPAQPLGGGFNASATTGVITLAQPLAPGASINLQLVLGVQTTGSFKFFFNIEALP